MEKWPVPSIISKAIRQIEAKMLDLKGKTALKKTNGKPEDPGESPRAKFGISGKEMIQKIVKQSGNSGRVYLPLNWVGKHVKIIRID